MAEVEELCDRVIVINNGTIIADDTPSQLATSITTAHVELLLRKQIKIAEAYFKKVNLQFEKDGNYLLISIPVKTIPEFLQDLSKQAIMYDEISITKPTLEDFFMEVIKKK